MKPSIRFLNVFHAQCRLLTVASALCAALLPISARSSQAYGTLNNFDCVNDTGQECHGFEIELDDCESKDITYTYDYNHYGTPTITEDTNSVPGHTNCLVVYAAVWTNSAWSAYTAIPAGPIPPTLGHQFTDPGTNFGGEHFGVGYSVAPSTVKYNWLLDDGTGTGTLALGPAVQVSTPAFTYVPPVAGQAAQVKAVIEAPEQPEYYVEFSDATWVKEIITTSHTNTEVHIGDLMTSDTNNPAGRDWRNGEPDEVEVEWTLMQIDYMATNGGANGELAGGAEALQQGDDVVTRRYEFYQYVGGYDPESHEALVDNVGADGIHGTGSYSNTVVVGDYIGAQMSAFAALRIGLIDHLPDGAVGMPYPTRSVVIAGDTNFTATSSGALPDGLSFDPVTGTVSGSPNVSGKFLFTVNLLVSNQLVATKNYPLDIADSGVPLPPHIAVDTLVAPATGGTAAGDGIYDNGDPATVTATRQTGYSFLNWTENGTVVSTSETYTLSTLVNHSLVANFINKPKLYSDGVVQGNSVNLHWPIDFTGYQVQVATDPSGTNWVTLTNTVNVVGGNNEVIVAPTNTIGFFRLYHP